MTSVYINPFDLRTVLVEYLLGSNTLLAIGMVLAYTFLAGYFQFSNRIYGVGLIFIGLLGAMIIGQIYFIIILILIGVSVFKPISRIWS